MHLRLKRDVPRGLHVEDWVGVGDAAALAVTYIVFMAGSCLVVSRRIAVYEGLCKIATLSRLAVLPVSLTLNASQDDNYNPPLCSNLYHDQSQTPGYPKGDGNCLAPGCDVGSVPVGE